MHGVRTPTQLDIPAVCMNFPMSVSNAVKNNVLMDRFDAPYDLPRAYGQFLELYREIAKGAFVYTLPTEADLQDLPFTANIGACLPHLDGNTFLLSRFKSKPRRGEEAVGLKFFESMRYKVVQCPFYWEGEADLKYLRDNVYFAPHGSRTDRAAHVWMQDSFDMDVVPVRLVDDRLYHLDCVLFPLDGERIVAATAAMMRVDIKRIEKYAEIIEVPGPATYSGWTNVVRLGQKILYAGDGTPDRIGEFYGKLGFEPVPVELSEFDKSGADLSCFVCHLRDPRWPLPIPP